MAFFAVVTTIDSRAQALVIARALVEHKLAACVQLANIESVFTWDGAVKQSREVRLLCKTTGERRAEVEAAIRALHTYDLPAIHAVELDDVDLLYGEWIVRGTTP
ncbi:MAG: divalent-cation tolerance protein CutA [Gemmatimonadota bacterium]|nr:divalent-cation tolerance protein CutA [Gemmatimonadota bacterium]